jgi:hypothetical protein
MPELALPSTGLPVELESKSIGSLLPFGLFSLFIAFGEIRWLVTGDCRPGTYRYKNVEPVLRVKLMSYIAKR